MKSKIKLLKHQHQKKDVHKNNESLNDLENDDKGNKIKDYINIVSSTENNILHKKNIIDDNLKEKYNHLNTLIKNLQKTTGEILERKII